MKQVCVFMITILIMLSSRLIKGSSSNNHLKIHKNGLIELQIDKIYRNQVNRTFTDKEEKVFIDQVYQHSKGNHDKKTPSSMKILKMIFGLFIFLSILSFYKINEETHLLKKIHVRSKFENVVEFDNEKMSTPEVDEKFIFTSGKANLLEGARDPLLKNLEGDYAKIKREVHIYNNSSYSWHLYESNHEETSATNIVSNEDNLFLKYSNMTYKVPKICTEIFIGKAQLNSINLTNAQIMLLTKNEIPFDLSQSLFVLPKSSSKITNTPGNDDDDESRKYNTNYEFYIKDNMIYVHPKEDNKTALLRIRYFGYQVQDLSILSEVKNSSFKTLRIPFNKQKYDLDDTLNSVNKSIDMGKFEVILEINSNVHCDFFNVIACFCLSGPPSYNYSQVEYGDGMTSASINWLREDIVSKDKIIEEKHGIQYSVILLTRFVFFSLIFIALIFFWEIIYYLGKEVFGLEERILSENLVLLSLSLSLIIMILIVIYTNIAVKIKNYFNVTICCGLVLASIFILTKEIIKLI